ncbi:MAG TPA: tRNA (adenosine(37)-N6)-threonylcarbamoyltransferase complex transferase subunit TsaD, partial [Planctomycetota bacterium]|nr:tRNA (adenosine(37)-N6)-threonylcarbamoyltransferase complex transferase subunit TsaD [Planctomycetota bacterium]
MRVLGIETSCDETAAAVVDDGRVVLASEVASSSRLHVRFGGVVPEIACREHLRSIIPVVEMVLETASVSPGSIDGIAVTNRPGLVGALLMGVSAAKALAWAWRKPLVALNHIEAHVYAARMAFEELDYPCMALVVSGGHTSIYHVRDVFTMELMGATTDDAAGEAFDKVAKYLGLLEGSLHGGPAIEKAARGGNPAAIDFPRSLIDKGFDFSFSGLKTAVLYRAHGQDASPPAGAPKLTDAELADVAASFQEAVVDVLTAKLVRAARTLSVPRMVVGGGVAANARLREKLACAAEAHHLKVYFPPIGLCTDNAVMIAGLGY